MRCFHRGMTVWRGHLKKQNHLFFFISSGWKCKKPYSTGDSLVVPYQSTEPAQRCLTSQFGWDAVLSPWYDRMTSATWKSRIWIKKSKLMKKINIFILFFCLFSRSRHCRPFISSTSSIIPNVRCRLPKFDSKILISCLFTPWNTYILNLVIFVTGQQESKIRNPES